MLVEGKIEMDIEITHKDAIEALLKEFLKSDNTISNNYCIMKINDKTGIYKVTDRYYAGSPDYDYELIHEGETAVRLYCMLRSLEALWNSMDIEEEKLSLTRKK